MGHWFQPRARFAVVRMFASEGLNVTINGRNPDTLEATKQRLRKEPGNRLVAIRGDLSQSAFPTSPAASYITSTMLTVDDGMYKETYRVWNIPTRKQKKSGKIGPN